MISYTRGQALSTLAVAPFVSAETVEKTVEQRAAAQFGPSIDLLEGRMAVDSYKRRRPVWRFADEMKKRDLSQMSGLFASRQSAQKAVAAARETAQVEKTAYQALRPLVTAIYSGVAAALIGSHCPLLAGTVAGFGILSAVLFARRAACMPPTEPTAVREARFAQALNVLNTELAARDDDAACSQRSPQPPASPPASLTVDNNQAGTTRGVEVSS